MKYKFGFIGCGNMGGAIARAVGKRVGGELLAFCDSDAAKAEELATLTGGEAVALSELAEHSSFIFLGVKPQGFEALFDTLRPILEEKKERTVLISMAAGISLSDVERMVGESYPIIRIMPNTPVSVGEGMVLYALGSEVREDEKQAFLDAMSASGKLDELPEGMIDAASALSGCGPAFVYLFAEGLADGAVECGLTRDRARLYAAQTLLGGARLLLESGKHSGELKDAVCSPGGTTIAGVHALEANGFRASCMDAVTAAYERTLELKK
ncbi:MAG: pyrroline-5-carboxylate reductase [Ruminococcaceae bacterium]|nr:pyrroline-5-carboxylate reductase [Oscillospiraceae bacterium]